MDAGEAIDLQYWDSVGRVTATERPTLDYQPYSNDISWFASWHSTVLSISVPVS